MHLYDNAFNLFYRPPENGNWGCLHGMFVEQVMKTEILDASSYQPTQLKTRLQRDYPPLVLHCPATRNQSELVFVEELSVGEVVETSDTVDTEVASDSYEEMIAETSAVQRDVTLNFMLL